MITSKTNPRNIKNIKKEDFQHQTQIYYNNYKNESIQAEEKHTTTPSPRGSIYSLSFFHPLSHCKALNGHEWLSLQLGSGRPTSQAMYDVLTIYQCKGVFYSIIFSAFILHWFQGLDARKSVTSNRTKRKDFIRKSFLGIE